MKLAAKLLPLPTKSLQVWLHFPWEGRCLNSSQHTCLTCAGAWCDTASTVAVQSGESPRVVDSALTDCFPYLGVGFASLFFYPLHRMTFTSHLDRLLPQPMHTTKSKWDDSDSEDEDGPAPVSRSSYLTSLPGNLVLLAQPILLLRSIACVVQHTTELTLANYAAGSLWIKRGLTSANFVPTTWACACSARVYLLERRAHGLQPTTF
jgi:hypothetical protein